MNTPSHSHNSHRFPWDYLAAALAVFCLGHWLGSLVLRSIQKALPALHHWPLLLSGVSLAILGVCSLQLRRLHHRRPRPQGLRDRAVQFGLSLAVLLAAFIAAVSLEHFLEHGPLHLADHPVIFASGCVVLLIPLEGVLHHVRQRTEYLVDVRPLLRQRSAADKAPDSELQALILFVSPPNHPITVFEPKQGAFHAEVSFNQSGKRGLKGGRENLERDIEELSSTLENKEYWNWQQLLRALRGHDSLRRVTLLGSEGPNGSHRHLTTCADFLRSYLPKGCVIQPHEAALDFRDFNILGQTLREIILHDLEFPATKNVGIDVTGGTATASISGAAATMNLDCIFQYVDTQLPYHTLSYDVIYHHGPNIHG